MISVLPGIRGIPGGGVNPLRGQNNVQGACDLGGLPNVFPGYQKVTDEESVSKFENAWGVKLSKKVGLPVTEVIPASSNGSVKALYIMGEDPIMSDPDSNNIRSCLEDCEFVILQEIFPSETSPYQSPVSPPIV